MRNFQSVRRQSRSARLAGISLCRWIAVQIQDASALHTGAVPHRTFRIDIADDESIVLRITVDDQRDRAVLLRFARLDSAERSPIARHRDLPAHRNAERVELRV